ncbi:MAG TPA: M20 family metallopeptidase [Actinomycetota bacterium]|nr:M20 family metallopeptidase [Actinomycetota bacterium]
MSDDLAQLVREHVDPDEVVEICRDLVRAQSENPPGDEREVAAAAESWLDRLGLPHERVEPEPGRVNVLSRWGDGDGPVLAFNGHYDVVPATDADRWPHPPFSGAIQEGKLYGRGSSDMKAGIAACLASVSALKRAGVTPRGKLLIHLVADEEALGVHGTKYLVDEGLCDGIDECVVGEPTSLHLVTSERGALWLRIRTQGVSAHGSTPQLGVNAIGHMARVVQAVSQMRFRKLHPVLGAPTVNVGTIAGGAKVNSVADSCVIEIDRRTLPGEELEEVVAEFESALDPLRQADPELRASVEVHNWAEACETPDGTSMVGLLAQARDAFGAEGAELGYSGATDARFLINQAKIPTVIFGPGDIMLAHTTGEHVKLDELAMGARVYAHAFARFLGVS